MARERPTASNVVRPNDSLLERAGVGDPLGLTRAEAHSLRRCAPLTPAQFKSLGRLAQQGVSPLRRV